MKIKYTGLVYGVFGSLLDEEDSVVIDLLNNNVKIFQDNKAIIIEKGLSKTRFQRRTVKIEIMG
ncbi:hypothetical protein Elgi_37820 [Paenibacillus elgii]|uniref:hypothetical protein n=1 Tax=Paenibacillus elgii TaxID=189691 RepID=UPI002D7CF523|nr:hypothetical protein Elgi_37820 [Paenibacillus elgii]